MYFISLVDISSRHFNLNFIPYLSDLIYLMLQIKLFYAITKKIEYVFCRKYLSKFHCISHSNVYRYA